MRKVHLLMLSLLAVGSAYAQPPTPTPVPPGPGRNTPPSPAAVSAPARVAPPAPAASGGNNPFKTAAPVTPAPVPTPAQAASVGPGMPPGLQGAGLPGMVDPMLDMKQPTMGKAMDGRTFVGVVGGRLLYRTADGYIHESHSNSQ